MKYFKDTSLFFIDWLPDTFVKSDTLRSAKLSTPNHVTVENLLFTARKAPDDAASQADVQKLLQHMWPKEPV